MPRLPHPLIHRARALHPLLPLLLRPCRDVPSALNELRWLREHAISNRNVALTSLGRILTTWPQYLHRMCLERARGKPLQYILGTQPFGGLEMLCKRGVLIPRLLHQFTYEYYVRWLTQHWQARDRKHNRPPRLPPPLIPFQPSSCSPGSHPRPLHRHRMYTAPPTLPPLATHPTSAPLRRRHLPRSHQPCKQEPFPQRHQWLTPTKR